MFTRLNLQYSAGENETPFASELFLLIEGPNAKEFCARSLLQDTKTICEIPKSSSLHWNAANGQLLATLDLDLTNSGEITELLIPYAKLAKQVLTITLKPKVEYKSEMIDKFSDDVAIVRTVGGNTGDRLFGELEAPNFIAGVAAGSKFCFQFC